MNLLRNLSLSMGGALIALACGADRSEHDGTPPELQGPRLLADSAAASKRIAALRQRFPTGPRSTALGPAVATRFELTGTSLSPVLPDAARLAVRRAATVKLPVRANGEVSLEDERSHVALRFALDGAHAAQATVADGIALYSGALDGADVVQRVHAEGTEDFVVFETRPAREALGYTVDVSRVAGLRLVERTLEFLDGDGSPGLRVAPPYVVDARGDRHEANLAVSGCAVDTDPRGPWGRAVTPPGSARCTVTVSWSHVTYPAMVDPAWVATGSMAVARYGHTMTLLQSGHVLVCRGPETSAELYEPNAGVFAATGPMRTVRWGASASLLPSGKVLFAGGSAESPASAELYDPATGTYKATGSLNVGRAGHTASVLLSGKVLLVGGANAFDSALASAELFDVSANGGVGAFSVPGSLVTGRTMHTSTTLPNGEVLVVAGHTDAQNPPVNDSVRIATVEIFDPTTNSFRGAGRLGQTREAHLAVSLASGKVLIASGYVGAGRGASLDTLLYDPATGVFGGGGMLPDGPPSSLTPLPDGGALALSYNAPMASLFELSAGKGSFTSIGPMSTTRHTPTAVALKSGKVLVSGGLSTSMDISTRLNTAEVFGLSVGDPCVAGGNCFSGACVDGVCCSTACDGACQACTAAKKQDGVASGTCGAAKAGADPRNRCMPYICGAQGCPTSCTSDAACVAGAGCKENKCLVANGKACSVAAECQSSFCTDGVCCDKACGGQCESCSATPGTCTPVSGTPRGGRPACIPGATCNAATSACDPAPPIGAGTPPASTTPPGTTSSGGPPASSEDGACSIGTVGARRDGAAALATAIFGLLLAKRRKMRTRSSRASERS